MPARRDTLRTGAKTVESAVLLFVPLFWVALQGESIFYRRAGSEVEAAKRKGGVPGNAPLFIMFAALW